MDPRSPRSCHCTDPRSPSSCLCTDPRSRRTLQYESLGAKDPRRSAGQRRCRIGGQGAARGFGSAAAACCGRGADRRRSAGQRLNWPVAQLASGSIGQWLNRPVAQSASGSIGQWLNRPVAQSVSGSTGRWPVGSCNRGWRPRLATTTNRDWRPRFRGPVTETSGRGWLPLLT